MSMPQAQFRGSGLTLPAVGLGCMRMQDNDTARGEAVAAIHAALDGGIRLLNTGDFYGMGESELVVREAIKGRRDQAFISVKYGGRRDPAGNHIGFDVGYEATLSSLAYSLRRMGTDYIDLYEPARIFPNVPLEETMGALQEAVKRGYIRHIGLSEVGPATIARAAAIHPITAVEAEYSIVDRDIEANVFPAARKAGAGVVAYAVLGGGLLSGKAGLEGRGPRFEPGNIEGNQAIISRLHEIAQDSGLTVPQLALAWILSRGDDIVALVGATRVVSVEEALHAASVTLSEATLAAIEEACPPGAIAGDYYGGAGHQQIMAERAQS